MMKKDPHCHWCGRKVFNRPVNRRYHKASDASIDHLVSKYGGKREDPRGKKKTLVLACYECNQKRCVDETSNKSKEELWARSGRYPKKLNSLNKEDNEIK